MIGTHPLTQVVLTLHSHAAHFAAFFFGDVCNHGFGSQHESGDHWVAASVGSGLRMGSMIRRSAYFFSSSR